MSALDFHHEGPIRMVLPDPFTAYRVAAHYAMAVPYPPVSPDRHTRAMRQAREAGLMAIRDAYTANA